MAAAAGRNVKVSSMELGGSDAFIVLEDADLDHGRESARLRIWIPAFAGMSGGGKAFA